jgi:signal transduction histidine kinase
VRIILMLIFVCLQLFALSKEEVIQKVVVATDNQSYISVEAFNEEHLKDTLYLKFMLNPKLKLNKETFYLRIDHVFNTIRSVNVPFTQEDNRTLIPISSDSKDVVLKMVSNFGDFSPNFFLYTQREFERFEREEYLLYGLAYGIIFCAWLYSMILFLYNRSKTFLYYGCFQASLLFFLILTVMTPSWMKPLFASVPVYDIMGQMVLVFAILFNRAFLNVKSFFPRWDMCLKVLIVLLLIDIVFLCFLGNVFIFRWIPTSFLLFLLVLTSLIVYKQGYKIAIFYILGWGVLVIIAFLVEFAFLDYPNVYALHFGLPFESLILSFTLGYRMKKLEDEKERHEKMLVHQNKLASMGEMINNIAHQYRQPLTRIGYIFMNIKSAYEHQKLNLNYLDSKIDLANHQLQFMSDTIDNFRDFYNQNTEEEPFFIKDAVQSAVDIILPMLEQHEIQLEMNVNAEVCVKGIENEYSQVVLNLLSNAKDALVCAKTEQPMIKIHLESDGHMTKLFFQDNGEGIPLEIQEKVFNPYFSTKSQSSGIGLYMSSLIIQEHFKGKLYLKPCQKGALFIIEV